MKNLSRPDRIDRVCIVTCGSYARLYLRRARVRKCLVYGIRFDRRIFVGILRVLLIRISSVFSTPSIIRNHVMYSVLRTSLSLNEHVLSLREVTVYRRPLHSLVRQSFTFPEYTINLHSLCQRILHNYIEMHVQTGRKYLNARIHKL